MAISGNLGPHLGFGTYGRRGAEGIAAISEALETGYRHIDTAQTYETEFEVGEAVQQSGLKREDVFLTTKISTENYAAGRLIDSLRVSLDTMQIDRVDLTLLHWPSPNGKQDLASYLLPLVDAQSQGLTQLIGVSNFPIAMLQEAEALIGPSKIATNQIELNPLIQNKKLARYCQEAGILVTCYQPMAHGRLGDEPTLREIAATHDASVEQVALAFELAKGYAAIPTSGKAERIRSNFAATNLSLSEDEIARIETCDRNQRAIDPDWGPAWD